MWIIEVARADGTKNETLGKMIYDRFMTDGAIAYRTPEHRCYWAWDGKIFEVDIGSQAFRSLIWKQAGITHEGTEGRKIWAVLKAETDTKGKTLTSGSWLHTIKKDHTIYLNPNFSNGSLIKITTDDVSTVSNGANGDDVILLPATNMTSTNLIPLDDKSYQDGLEELKGLIMDNIACSAPDKYLFLSWILCYPLMDYSKTLPHMRASGPAGYGKTYAMDVLSYLVYGNSQLKKTTDAALYADAAQNPLQCLDNLEATNLTTALNDFLLTSATGTSKLKRKLGTDHDVVREQVKTLNLSSGIESLGLNELITRTLVCEFDRYKYASPNWSEMIYDEIVDKREVFLSVHMRLISTVLKKIKNGGLDNWVRYLERNYPDHPKNRLNRYIALMAMVLENLTSNDNETKRIISEWMESQRVASAEIQSGTNQIVMYLNSLVDEYDMGGSDNWNKSGYTVSINRSYNDSGGYTMTGTASQFLVSFSSLARNKGLKFTFNTSIQLSKRIRDSVRILEEAGIGISTKTSREKTMIYSFTIGQVDQSSEDKAPF